MFPPAAVVVVIAVVAVAVADALPAFLLNSLIALALAGSIPLMPLAMLFTCFSTGSRAANQFLNP